MSQIVPLKKFKNEDSDVSLAGSFVAQMFVFQGEQYLGWDCFDKNNVVVGKSPHADLILDEKYISEIHAIFHMKDDQIIISDQNSENGVRVNGKAVDTCSLGPLDVVSIGTYTIKTRLKKIQDIDFKEKGTFNSKIFTKNESEFKPAPVEIDVEEIEIDNNVVDISSAENEIIAVTHEDYEFGGTEDENVTTDISSSKHIDVIEESYEFGSDYETELTGVEEHTEDETYSPPTEIEVFHELYDFDIADESKKEETAASIITELPNSKTEYTVPDKKETGHSGLDSAKGIDTEIIEPENNPVDILQISNSVSDQLSESANDLERKDAFVEKKRDFENYSTDYDDYDDDDDVEDDEPNILFLKEKFEQYHQEKISPSTNELIVEIVKYRNDDVIDAGFISTKEKYYYRDEKRRNCMVEYTAGGKMYVFVHQLDGMKIVAATAGESAIDPVQMMSSENLYRKRKQIYRIELPENGSVTLSDDIYTYFIRSSYCQKSPNVAEPKRERFEFKKYMLRSVGFHAAMLLLLGIFISLPEAPTPIEEARFVQLDTTQLLKKEKPIPPPSPPKKTEPVKKKTELKKDVPKPKKRLAKLSNKKTKSRRKGKRASVSRSPKAGGGAGKAGGNVSNRNVAQAGILGALGISDGIGLMPNEAIAAVTNLDAVSSTRSKQGNFKVGGIVGKLGSSKISVPSGGVVTTKGSNQVLRSAGVKGKGSVAALAKGKTGENQVMAVVSAKLDKKVSINGGMSREAVKKVIDQHLDEVSYCYESALVSNPSISGKVIFEWKILKSGRVGEVRIKNSTINSSGIHSCIKLAIKSWEFPKPKGSDVVVSYPFIFDVVGF